MYAVPYLQLKRQLCPKQKQFLQPRRQRAAVRTPVMIQTLRRRRSQQRLAFLSSLFNVRLTVMNNSKFDQQNCVWNWARLSWAIKCPGCCRYNAKRHFRSAIGTGPCKNKFLVQHPLSVWQLVVRHDSFGSLFPTKLLPWGYYHWFSQAYQTDSSWWWNWLGGICDVHCFSLLWRLS